MSEVTASFELERFAWADGAFEVVGRWHADTAGPLGRARLVVEIDGRRRRIGAQGGKQASVTQDGEWRARFGCARRPASVGPAELEVGGALVIDLPSPELPPQEREDDMRPDVRDAEQVLERLRSERAALEAAAGRVSAEREAAEAAMKRLAEERERATAAAREAAEQAATELVNREAGKAADRAVREAVERVTREMAAGPAPKAPPEPERPARRGYGAAPPSVQRSLEGDAAPPRLPPTPRRLEIHEALERPREPQAVVPAWLGYVLAPLIVILIVVLAVLLL